MSTDSDMLWSDFRHPVFNNDRRPTNPSSVARDVNGMVMVIDIDTDKFTDTPRSAQPSEVCNKPGGRSG